VSSSLRFTISDCDKHGNTKGRPDGVFHEPILLGCAALVILQKVLSFGHLSRIWFNRIRTGNRKSGQSLLMLCCLQRCGITKSVHLNSYFGLSRACLSVQRG
jgi:hypothetical protein